MQIASLILAAGEGRRIANLGIKPFLKFKGKTFIEVAIEKSQMAGFQPIIVVTNKGLEDRMKKLKQQIEIIINPHPEQGMLSSIKCGLGCLDQTTAGFLLNPVDYPLVKLETYQKLWQAHQDEIECIVKPLYDGKSGHPVIFPALVLEEVKSAPLNEGARYIINKYPNLVRNVQVDDSGVLININTPELYFKYCE